MSMKIYSQMSQTLKNMSESFHELMMQVQGEQQDINQWNELVPEEPMEFDSGKFEEYGEDHQEQLEEDENELMAWGEDNDAGEVYYDGSIAAMIDSPLLARGFYMGIPVDVYACANGRGQEPDTLLPDESGLFEENY
jgi:hypothetical protein